MDAVIALCHFCENHGPSVMFCCEKGSGSESQNLTSNVVENFDVFTPGTSLESNGFTVGSWTQKSQLSRQSSTSSSVCSAVKTNKANLCQACQSIPDDHNGYISFDSSRGESFISSQHPMNGSVFSKVRQACLRSLSGEVCPGREGPIFFGDEKDGYVLSYTFFIEDSKARGFKRWYSIIVVMMDRIFLIQSWSFLVESIEKIKNYLQRSACNVYKSEESEISHQTAKIHLSAYRRCTQITPENFRQSRSGTSNARALVKLTGDDNLYGYLHTVFTWIMRSTKLRLKERIPCTAEKRDTLRSISFSTQSSFDSERADILSPTTETDPNGTFEFTSLRHMRELLDPLLFKALAWNVLVGNQVIWRGPDHIVASALDVLKDVLPQGCIKMSTKCNTYLDSYKANFLGLNEGVDIPKHIFVNEKFILIDVLLRQQSRTKSPKFFQDDKLCLSEVEFKMKSSCVMPEKVPNILNKLEVALANDKLSESVVQHILLCLKEEWFNNAKILYKIKKVDNRSTEDTNEILFSCLQCNEEDVKLLKFWMVGLDRHFKGDLTSEVLRNKS